MFVKDKYKPDNVNDIFFHKQLIKKLCVISKDKHIPNIIFCGPEGSGKSTIIKLFLEMLYGKHINTLSDVQYSIVGSGNVSTTVLIKQSMHHIVIEPFNTNFDRYVVQDIVKEYAKKTPCMFYKKQAPFKTVLIKDINRLSYYAQTSLRRTMEKYVDNCRFIMSATSMSKVLEPLRSRCIILSVPRPNNNEIFRFIFEISLAENMFLSLDQLIDIVDKSNGNIKNALWAVDLIKHGVFDTSYSRAVEEVCEMILCNNIKIFDNIINIFYKLIITNISSSAFVRDILIILLKSNICDDAKYKILQTCAKYESRIAKSRREIVHIQCMIYHIFEILSNWQQ